MTLSPLRQIMVELYLAARCIAVEIPPTKNRSAVIFNSDPSRNSASGLERLGLWMKPEGSNLLAGPARQPSVKGKLCFNFGFHAFRPVTWHQPQSLPFAP